jgi:DNA replication protein DnaC
VISTRHAQRKSTVITTNTPFSDWGNILYNTTIATAIADRLVENSEVFLLGGDSLRKAKKTRPSAKTTGSEEAPLCDDNPNRRSPAG